MPVRFLLLPIASTCQELLASNHFLSLPPVLQLELEKNNIFSFTQGTTFNIWPPHIGHIDTIEYKNHKDKGKSFFNKWDLFYSHWN